MALRAKSPAVINHDDTAILVDPNDIEDGPRIGLFWPEKADAIGALMRVDGQNEPIKIRKNAKGAEKPWLLVVGMHRKHGAIRHGIAQISALVVKGSGWRGRMNRRYTQDEIDDMTGIEDDCPHCGGEGVIYDCIDGQCLDAEIGCDLCSQNCDYCR